MEREISWVYALFSSYYSSPAISSFQQLAFLSNKRFLSDASLGAGLHAFFDHIKVHRSNLSIRWDGNGTQTMLISTTISNHDINKLAELGRRRGR